MKFTVERNWIDMLGHIWQPGIQAVQRIDLGKYEIENIGEPTRDNVEFWLFLHAGDFQSIDDFHAVIGEIEIDWQVEENEYLFNDAMYPMED